MKRFTMISFALLLVLALLATACAECIQSEQVDVPVEEACVSLVFESVDDLDEVDLWDPDIYDDGLAIDARMERHAIEAANLDDDVTAYNDDEYLRKGSASASGEKPKLNATSVQMGAGETYQLVASAKGYSFSSSNKKIAKVSSDGIITAKNTGNATITVKNSKGQKATCKVTVKKAPKKVTLNKSKVTLQKGKTFQLKVTLPKGTYTSRLTWTTSNKKVAKVDGKGVVTAVGNGTATITVKTAGGVKATCKVTVKPATIDLAGYVGKNLKETAKELNLKYNGYGYGNSIIWIEEVSDYITGKNGTFIAIQEKNSKYSIAGVTYGMNIEEAEKTLKSRNWKRTEVDKSYDSLHHYYYQNSKGHEIDLYVYEPKTNKKIEMIIIRQSKNERWPEL